MTPYIKIIGAAVLAGAAFVGGVTVEHWRSGVQLANVREAHATALAKANGETLEAQRKIDATAAAARAYTARVDTEQTQALKVAQDETNRLRSCIADGTCGLRIRTQCPKPAAIVPGTAASASVGIATSTELADDARQDYFALRGAIDTVQRQLAACQAIASR